MSLKLYALPFRKAFDRYMDDCHLFQQVVFDAKASQIEDILPRDGAPQ